MFQVSRSTSQQVVLREASRALAGRYRCEVSADAPSFHTQVRSAYIHVVGEYLPRIFQSCYENSQQVCYSGDGVSCYNWEWTWKFIYGYIIFWLSPIYDLISGMMIWSVLIIPIPRGWSHGYQKPAVKLTLYLATNQTVFIKLCRYRS